MERIASFEVDHRYIVPGIYLSRIDGDITTYDLRTRKPNCGDFMSDSTMHTFEHLFATYVRNSEWKDSVIYIGPMGCRTGFYMLLRNSVSKDDAIILVKDAFGFITNFEGAIPGAARKECGNYLEHDLDGAKCTAEDMLIVLQNWTKEKLNYEYQK